MYPFSYHVVLCSEYTDFKREEHQGVTFGHNMAEAMAHIESYYGHEIESCGINYLDGEQEVLELKKEVVADLENSEL